jgi:solute carrier family 25 2-oxodicarboxylate transporter 21
MYNIPDLKIFDCFQKIIKEEGFGRLYRGIVPVSISQINFNMPCLCHTKPIMMEAPKRAIKFAANEQYNNMYRSSFNIQSGITPTWLPVLTGVSAGCTEAFVVVPFDLVKIRLQDKQSAGKYKNTMDCVRKYVFDYQDNATNRIIHSFMLIWIEL